MKALLWVVGFLFTGCLVALPAANAQTEQTSVDLFGSSKGNWHPSLGLSGVWEDNLFNTPNKEKSDFVTVVNPGLWLAFPARFDQPASLETVNSAPGALSYSLLEEVSELGTYQFYAAYSANFEIYDKYSDEDQTTQKVEAKLGYYPGPKTRVELQQVYDDNREAFGTGTAVSDQDDDYQGYLTTLSLGYQLTEKLNLQANGSYYKLDYKESFSSFREREDRTAGGKVSFTVTPKVDLFAEYLYTDIDYKSDSELDSDENKVYAGLTWNITDKTTGLAKVGYNKKDYSSQISSEDELEYELQLDYQLSDKTTLNLRGLRYLNETDIETTSGRLTHEAGAVLNYQVLPKVSSNLKLSWLKDDYNGDITVGPKTDEREDDYLNAGIDLTWQAKSWMAVSCGYEWEDRDSNFNDFDYTSNIVYISLSAAL